MDDETRLKKTKMRLKRLKGFGTLSSLALHKIVKNIKYFLGQKGKLEFLPGFLHEEILHRLTRLTCSRECGDLRVFNALLTAFQVLLSRQTKKVELNGLMTFCPETLHKNSQYTKVLERIAALAPNVQHVAINETDTELAQVFAYESLGRERLSAVCSLSKLKMLRVDSMSVLYSELKALCRRMPTLRCVDVSIDYDEVLLDDEVGCFSHLKCFFFSGMLLSMHDRDEQLASLCVRHLPGLRLVHSPATCHIFDMEGGAWQRRLLPIQPPRLPSELRHLTVLPGPVELHRLLPKVTHLKVVFSDDWSQDGRDVDPLLQFPKVESLCLENVPTHECFDRFLHKYQANLRALYLTAEYEFELVLSLGQILRDCPKLETLCLRYVNVQDTDSKISFFANLKELQLAPLEACECNLSNVLAAPNLEKISLLSDGSYDFDLDDLKMVSTLISEGRILRRLTTFRFQLLSPVSLDETNAEYFAALSELFKDASAFLPNLVHLDAKFDFATVGSNTCRSSEESISSRGKMAAAFNRLGDKNLIKFFDAFDNAGENIDKIA